MKLLIDIGNTRLKWAECQAGKLCQTGMVVHVHESIKPLLESAWQVLVTPKRIYVA